MCTEVRPSLETLSDIHWDLLVIGGGITGATIMNAAAERGLKVLLVEQHDFASGTSSRSSKLIHGGLHYLARGQFGLARSLVRERERLIATMPGLVERTDVLLPLFASEHLHKTAAGLRIYEAFAGRYGSPRFLDRPALRDRLGEFCPDVDGAFLFTEGVVDDARLVMRRIADGRRFGGHALNYVAVSHLLRDRRGRVVGAALHRNDTAAEPDLFELRARKVINATGGWCEQLLAPIRQRGRVRLVRGSHLVVSRDRLPIGSAMVMRHPDSADAFYVVPWEGAVIVGSTNVELQSTTPDNPLPSQDELDYLMRGLRWTFPRAAPDWSDVRSVYSGIRAITDPRPGAASKASREVAIWNDHGLLTVTGGKLSTADLIAAHVLARAFGPHLRPHRAATRRRDELNPVPASRLLARYGEAGRAEISHRPLAEQQTIPGQPVSWAEVRYAVRHEDVHHLDDLLLRRFRLGLTERDGGIHLLDSVKSLVQDELGWDNSRWEQEAFAYRSHWQRSHGLPPVHLAAD